MPKHNKRVTINDSRANRRASNTNQDPERSDLLAKILEEGSSLTLNDGSRQQNPRQVLEAHYKLLDLIDHLRRLESNQNPKLPNRNEQSVKKFFEWLEKNSQDKTDYWTNKIDVVAKDKNENLEGGDEEFALVAKVPFKKADKIFCIKRELILSTETAAKDDDLADFIRRDSIASTMQNVVLALHLLNEHSKGDRSYWQPYLNVLPRKILPILILDKEKLKCLLASSHIFEALKMIRAISRQYSYFYKRLQSTHIPLSKNLTYDYYCWGVSMVCSRQNEIPHSNRKNSATPVVLALIPILDMCNHNHESNQAVFETGESRVFAVQNIDKDEEITINYGTRSSGEYFIHNGFVPEVVQHDIIPLNIALDKQSSLFQRKANLLKTLNMPNFGRFRLTRNDYKNRHKRDPHLTMFLIVYLMNEIEMDFIDKSDNPVGVADEIYEYVQYDSNPQQQDENTDRRIVLKMKERLASAVKDYLSKRASISIALIDRSLNEDIPKTISTLLKRERSVYESYLINYT